MTEEESPLDALIHDVRSKSATLSDAATALQGATAEKRDRLLKLMVVQAEDISRVLADFLSGQQRA
ncbi:MAG: hypothetical protein KGL53_15280 [Elusimicrobia bacterium]|nr:hypothetical protein [Elusimicrobiota bacterium]